MEKTMINRKTSLVALSLIATITLSGCVINVGDNGDYHDGGDVSSVMGSVTIYKGRHAGDVSSINGSITLQDFTVAEDVSTVNGSVNIGENVAANSVATVNGDIEAGRSFNNFGDLDTINGDISLSKGSLVDGDIETANGDIELPGVEVKGELRTLNGDITLTDSTHVFGDIVFEEAEDGWESAESNWPVLSIDHGVMVNGNIILERGVKLELADKTLESKVIRHNRS